VIKLPATLNIAGPSFDIRPSCFEPPRFKRRLEKMALAHERLAEKYRIKLWEKKSQSERGRRWTG
jgi:hypothetical protein